MYCADRSCTTNVFEKILVEVCKTHLYASFGTFYAKIGHLFEAQGVFQVCLKNREIAVIEGKCRRFRNSSDYLKIHSAANN